MALSFRRLARKLGVDPGTLARWEPGRSVPKVKQSEKFIKMLSE